MGRFQEPESGCGGPQNGGMLPTKDMGFHQENGRWTCGFNKTILGNSLPNQSGLENRPFASFAGRNTIWAHLSTISMFGAQKYFPFFA